MLLKDTPAQTIIADRAYAAKARVIEPLEAAGKTVVIAPKISNPEARSYGKQLYKAHP